jgi:hypothetical protein
MKYKRKICDLCHNLSEFGGKKFELMRITTLECDLHHIGLKFLNIK